jgi:hypothetical protein
MSSVTVYRKDIQLRGHALAANTLASFLVAQGRRSLPDLSESIVMSGELLLFLNRQTMLDYWCATERRWLSRCGSGYVLTRAGLDMILNREANQAMALTGRRNAYNVSPELVRLARYFILSGRLETETAVEVLSFRLDLDVPEGNWTV